MKLTVLQFVVYCVQNTLMDLEMVYGYFDNPENVAAASQAINFDLTPYADKYIKSMSPEQQKQRKEHLEIAETLGMIKGSQ